jgi:uncharacterized protein
VRLRVPGWVRRGFAVSVNGVDQEIEAVPGTYVSISRTWAPGDVVDVSMPLSIRAVPTIDNPAIQSIENGPTVLLARSSSRQYLQLSLYSHTALDGTLDAAFTDLGDGYHRLGDLTFEPAWSGDDTQYHLYIERSEPRIVFAGRDSGVPNAARPDGTTFLDAVWADGGFTDRSAFLRKVQRTVEEFSAEGLLGRRNGQRVLVAAGKAKFA